MHAPYQRTVRAPAKINLLLRILAQEQSGFHGIETVFQRLALADVVHVSVGSDTRSLQCDGPTMPEGGLGAAEENLAWRAAARFTDATRWDTGWHIAIEKHIPVGGGLGGGSSDAASVLRALNALCPTPLSADALSELGATLGADVPFFVSDASLALAWGRGDRLLPLAALPPMRVTLVAFRDGVSTGAAYRAFSARRAASLATVSACVYPSAAFESWDELARVAANDFEDVVCEMHDGVASTLPAIRAEAARLRGAGSAAIGLLSGSGASCYLLHPAGVTVELSAPLGDVLQTETA